MHSAILLLSAVARANTQANCMQPLMWKYDESICLIDQHSNFVINSWCRFLIGTWRTPFFVAQRICTLFHVHVQKTKEWRCTYGRHSTLALRQLRMDGGRLVIKFSRQVLSEHRYGAEFAIYLYGTLWHKGGQVMARRKTEPRPGQRSPEKYISSKFQRNCEGEVHYSLFSALKETRWRLSC